MVVMLNIHTSRLQVEDVDEIEQMFETIYRVKDFYYMTNIMKERIRMSVVRNPSYFLISDMSVDSINTFLKADGDAEAAAWGAR